MVDNGSWTGCRAGRELDVAFCLSSRRSLKEAESFLLAIARFGIDALDFRGVLSGVATYRSRNALP